MTFSFSAYGVRVTVPPARRYRGRRARRQAFYSRQRLCRALTQFVRIGPAEWENSVAQARRDMILTGLGAVEVKWDRGDGEGFTDKPLAYGEWPRAMLRTRHVSLEDAGFYDPPRY